MAFNPNLDAIVGTGLSGASQGTPANKGLGELFQGLGETLSNVANSANQQRTTEISLAASKNADEQADIALASRVTPAEIKNGAEELMRYRSGSEAGKVPMSFVYSRTLQKVKELKSKYPGYADIIDSEFSSALGQNIGMKLAQQLDQEAASRGEIIDSQIKFNRQYAKDNDAEISFLVAQGILPKKPYLTGEFDTEEVLPSGITIGGAIAGYKAQKLVLEANKMNREETVDNAKITATEQTRVLRSTLFNVGSAQMTSYLESVNKARSAGSPGGAEITAEEKLAIRNGLGQLRTSGKLQLDGILNGIKNLSSVDRKSIEEEFETSFKILDEQLFEERTGLLTADKNYNTDLVTGRSKDLLKAHPPLLDDAALGQAGVSQGIRDRIWETGELRKLDVHGTVEGLTDPSFSISDRARNLKKDGISDKKINEQIRFDLDNLVQIIQDPTTPIDKATVAVNNLFKDKELLKKIAAGDPYVGFKLLVTPGIIEKVKNTKDYEVLYSFADAQFDEILSDGLQELGVLNQRDLGITVSFDEGTNTFSLDYKVRPGRGAGESGKIQAQAEVDKINGYLNSMKPLVEVSGQKFNDYLEYKFGVSKLWGKPEFGPEEKGLLRKMFDSFKLKSTGPEDKQTSPGTRGKQSLLEYKNEEAIRNKPLTRTLESKLETAISSVFGEGYKAQVYSGGQEPKGKGSRRTGSRRHDEGHAGDVYIIGPNGKRVTNTEELDKIKEFWLAHDFGSVGTYMEGGGIHLDEITQDLLKRGEALSWNY